MIWTLLWRIWLILALVHILEVMNKDDFITRRVRNGWREFRNGAHWRPNF